MKIFLNGESTTFRWKISSRLLPKEKLHVNLSFIFNPMKSLKTRNNVGQGVVILLLVILLAVTYLSAQHQSGAQEQKSQYRLMFYNLENLFDIENDPATNDDEFTPGGSRRWTNKKLYTKLNNTYKVIMAVGGWEPPSIVGMCEVENLFVLQKLIYETPLKKFDYEIIHYDSPDNRGIDVAMIYRKNDFTPLHTEPVPVIFPDDTSSKTRDILYVKGLIGDLEMVHIFINHWPSRFGGYMETKPKRNRAAEILKHKTDSLFAVNPNVSIIIMGDFNDGVEDQSIADVLQAKKPDEDAKPGLLYNLMRVERAGWKYGTLKYREYWDTFDQVIVSGGVLSGSSNLSVDPAKEVIFHGDFLLQPDERYMGEQLFRTYTGFKYLGGFSDHLPVYVDLQLKVE